MKAYTFFAVILFALFLSSNNMVEAQVGSGLDTLTKVNGWRLISYASGVHYARTYFDNTSAHHGRFSQWFGVERLQENVADAGKYWALFQKKLNKPIKIYNQNTNPIGWGSIWVNYSRSKPMVSGYGDVIHSSIAFGWKGQISDYSDFGRGYDGPWAWAPFAPPQFDSVDCVYLKLSGNFKTTYIQVDYIYFDRGDLGDPLSVIDDFEDSTIVDVEKQKELPTSYSLSQNYPNPFNPETSISYQISISGYVTLKVFDLLGREVATLVDEEKSIGTHIVKFNGSGLASGTYFYQINVDRNKFTQVKKMLLVK